MDFTPNEISKPLFLVAKIGTKKDKMYANFPQTTLEVIRVYDEMQGPNLYDLIPDHDREV
jgi:hypothetical protein